MNVVKNVLLRNRLMSRAEEVSGGRRLLQLHAPQWLYYPYQVCEVDITLHADTDGIKAYSSFLTSHPLILPPFHEIGQVVND